MYKCISYNVSASHNADCAERYVRSVLCAHICCVVRRRVSFKCLSNVNGI